MPLYEYYCRDCNGVFELLRPARDATKSQPCPECDEDSERIMSREWAAFIFRDGFARRIPDDGKFWHLGQKVSSPISGPTDGISHPEIKKPDDTPEPTVEDVERFEVLADVKRERDLETGGAMHDQQFERAEDGMRQQLRKRGSTRTEQEKQRVRKRLASENARARRTIAQEQRASTSRTKKGADD